MGLADLPTVDEARALRPVKQKWELPEEAQACERCGAPMTVRQGYAGRFCGRKCAAAYRADKRRKPRATCLVCGKPGRTPRHRSCSAECANKVRRRLKPRNCVVCGKEHFSKGKIRLKYCSRECYRKGVSARPAMIEVACLQCARMFRRTRAAVRRGRFVFCNHVCQRKFLVGINHPTWRGGSDPNRGSGWLKIAAQIRKRDGYCCQRCGRTQADNKRKLDVDHIRPWRSFDNEAEANQPTNLVALCSRCHRKKTNTIERAWLRGDVIGMQQYEKAVKSPPLFMAVNS